MPIPVSAPPSTPPSTPETVSNAQQIWQVLGLIPSGKVVSYGQLAEFAGLPGYARFVGTTLRKLPGGSTLPWHRVVNAAGKLSFPKDSQKYREQQQRLLFEGVVFNNQRIPMKIYRWQP
ncbi:MAG: methylated-DNA-protein-cysteine methyltransferase-like protein [Motiliproteus sp.]|jgi:methylated-DNA-protein-cysteine methyltransferase-like protein